MHFERHLPTRGGPCLHSAGAFLACALALAAWSKAALADGSPVPVGPAGVSTSAGGEPIGVSKNVSANAGGFGQNLANHGIYLNAEFISQVQGVTSGGLQHGIFPTNYVLAGMDFDLQRIASIPGASIHLQTNDLSGQGNYAGYNGSNWVWLNNWVNHNGYQLRELTWDQHLFNDHLLILVGRSNPRGAEFDGSSLYCNFATAPCGIPGLFAAAGGSPTFETSSWSGRVTVKPTPATYIKAGIWEDEPSLRNRTDNGWPGRDWGLNRSAGAFIPIEAGMRTTFANDAMPRQYDVGFTYDTASYNDPLLNRAYKPRPLNGGTPLVRAGRSTVYAQAQQMIWRPDHQTHRGLSVFAAGNLGVKGELSMRADVLVGAVAVGMVPSRPHDTIGVASETFFYGHAFLQAMRERIAQTGRPGDISGSETSLEVNYGVALGRAITVEPYPAYIWHPDLTNDSAPRAGVTHAVQVGVMLTFDVNAALDAPHIPRLRF